MLEARHGSLDLFRASFEQLRKISLGGIPNFPGTPSESLRSIFGHTHTHLAAVGEVWATWNPKIIK